MFAPRPLLALLTTLFLACSHAPAAAPGPVHAAADLDRLRAIASGPPDARADSTGALPEPLRRYFAYTGADRAPPARWARFRYQGEVRLPQLGDRSGVRQSTPWMPASGTQTMALSAQGLGYVWDSRWTSPRFAVEVRDRYVDGRARIHAVRSDGQVMVDEETAAMARTYLIRFFAEATQSPTMLLPGSHLTWEPIDAGRARARISDRGLQASMVCHFDELGALTRCESDDRMLRYSGDVAERWVPARWVMTRSDYREVQGLRLPSRMTVSWQLPGGLYEQVRETIELESLAME